MKTRELDDLVAEALTEEEREFLKGLEEPSMMQQSFDLFRGHNRTMNFFMVAAIAVFLAICVYSLVQFLRADSADDVTGMLRWGAALFYSLIMVFGIKVWGWMEMQSNAIRREIKRVELQIASLAHRGGEAD